MIPPAKLSRRVCHTNDTVSPPNATTKRTSRTGHNVKCLKAEHEFLLLVLRGCFQKHWLRLRFLNTGSLPIQKVCYYLFEEYLELSPVLLGQLH